MSVSLNLGAISLYSFLISLHCINYFCIKITLHFSNVMFLIIRRK